MFLSAVHFEHRADALSFPGSTSVEVKYSVELQASVAEDGRVGLITARIKTIDDPEALYRFHFELQGLVEAEAETPNLSVGEYLTKVGATMLYPFLRETVASITGRGRFGPVFLKPFNVGTLVEQPAPEAAVTGE